MGNNFDIGKKKIFFDKKYLGHQNKEKSLK
jgi:hypothetical protein